MIVTARSEFQTVARASDAAEALALRDGWLFDSHRAEVMSLLQQVDVALAGNEQRAVSFLSCGRGAGTTSVAWAYARASAMVFRRRVLLLDAAGRGVNLLQPLAAQPGHIPALTIEPLTSGIWTAAFRDRTPSRDEITTTVANPEFWGRLRENFDEVVVDSPAASESHLGLTIASRVDGVVLLVEAEKTRAPVARRLLDDLRAVRANVVGSIFNRRRFHVPTRIYGRL